MSRLGKTPILIPKGVDVKETPDGIVTAKGIKGGLKLSLVKGISIKKEAEKIMLEYKNSRIKGSTKITQQDMLDKFNK